MNLQTKMAITGLGVAVLMLLAFRTQWRIALAESPNCHRKPAETLAAPQTTGKIPAISSRFWSPKPANLPLSNQPLGFGPVGEAALVASPRPSPDAVRRAQAEARHDSLSLRVQAPVGDPGRGRRSFCRLP